ncbi:MAG: uroporphyrinogen-III synthase [Deferribacterales bacterium]
MPGRKILITRQPEQSIEFINKLSFNRFYPYLLPMIKTVPLKFDIQRNRYDFIIITSVNTVEFLKLFMDKINYNRAIAVGSKTKQAIEMIGFSDVEIPQLYSQKGVIKYLENEDLKGKSFFIPGAEERPGDLIDFLLKRGAEVDAPSIYTTEKVCYDNGYIVEFLNELSIDAVTFFSPSAGRSFFSQVVFSEIKKIPLFVSIGPTTHDYLLSIGIKSIYPKTEFTVDGVINLLTDIYRR